MSRAEDENEMVLQKVFNFRERRSTLKPKAKTPADHRLAQERQVRALWEKVTFADLRSLAGPLQAADCDLPRHQLRVQEGAPGLLDDQ